MRTTAAAALATIILFGPAVPARGQGCQNLMCAAMVCTVTATVPSMTTGGMNYYSLKPYPAPMISMANCSPNMASSMTDNMAPFALVLMGTGTGAPASCSWALLAARQTGVASFSCGFDEANGLPVELLGFSVLEDEESSDSP